MRFPISASLPIALLFLFALETSAMGFERTTRTGETFTKTGTGELFLLKKPAVCLPTATKTALDAKMSGFESYLKTLPAESAKAKTEALISKIAALKNHRKYANSASATCLFDAIAERLSK